jgi:hypothetical protein
VLRRSFVLIARQFGSGDKKEAAGGCDGRGYGERTLVAGSNVDWVLADSGDVSLTTAEFCRCAFLAGPLGMAI